MKNRNSRQPEPDGYYLAFTLSDRQFALPLATVQRVLHAVEVTKLPKAPEIVCGVIDYRGTILPVVNISRRFHLPEQEIHPRQNFIIASTPKRKLGLVADTVTGVINAADENVTPPADITGGIRFLAGVLKMETGMMFIPDIHNILTHDEEKALENAVKKNKKQEKKGGK